LAVGRGASLRVGFGTGRWAVGRRGVGLGAGFLVGFFAGLRVGFLVGFLVGLAFGPRGLRLWHP
jgi:hypothetical protein